MAQDDDKEKVEAALAKEVDEETQDESKVETPDSPETPNEPEESEAQAEEESSSEEETPAEQPSTFTKPQGYEWVKGETLEEFNQNLITAYENSTKEALKLRQQVQAPAAPATPPAPNENQFDINSVPEIQMLRAEQQSKMVEAFDGFSAKYPQAREPQSFDQFEKATAGASQAFVAAFGRVPTYPELFEKTAQLLGWQPSDKNAKKDAAIKDVAASTGTSQATSPPPKQSPFTAKQLEIARRTPGSERKTDAELIKELTEAVQA